MPPREGVPPVWYEWCVAWRLCVTGDLTPRVADAYLRHLTTTGRWLAKKHPHIISPGQWTEDLAFKYRATLPYMTVGEYASPRRRAILHRRGVTGQPLKPRTLTAKLVSMRRFFDDRQHKPHSINGEPARKIPLLFKPAEALALLKDTARIMEVEDVEPRNIDPVVWPRLACAAARLTEEDVHWRNWPLSAIRAMAFL